MRLTLLLVIFFISGNTLTTKAQSNSISNDSITIFYDSLFSHFEKEYLYRKDVDWGKIKKNLYDRLTGYYDFKSSLAELTPLLDEIKADHISINFNNQTFTGTQKPLTGDDFSPQWLKKYSAEPGFEVKLIDEKYGYILMPSVELNDTISSSIVELGQKMYDQIADIKMNYTVSGWIVDLRFNSGGNVSPMLLGLYDLLGENEMWGVLDKNKEPISKFKFQDGKYFENDKKLYEIDLKGNLEDMTKVALITGIITASSGEIVCMAFKGRKNTFFIGEETMGATTTNEYRGLPFGAFSALTTGLDCDRKQRFYKTITPDIRISKKDNFDNYLSDDNIIEAIRFFENE